MAKKQEEASSRSIEKKRKNNDDEEEEQEQEAACSTSMEEEEEEEEEEDGGTTSNDTTTTTTTDKDDEEEEDESRGGYKCKFPMHRINRIVRSDLNSNTRVAQDAIFLINTASEKFLQLLSREAYASSFIDHKNYVAYNHLSSVIAKRKRLHFLSDFVPQKVEAEHALKQISGPEN